MDVFGGWDGQAVGSRWFPLVVEVSNKGLPLSGFVEVQIKGPVPQVVALNTIEIPTQSNKRLWIYAPPLGYHGDLEVRLLNHRGRLIQAMPLRLESLTPPSRLVAESIPSGWLKMGLKRQKTQDSRPDWNSTRILKQHLPDSSVGYDGLDALHLGWSEVDDLNANQRQALLDWISSGGHLIASAEDANAWRGNPWWTSVLPLSVESQKAVSGLISALEPFMSATNSNGPSNLGAQGTRFADVVSSEKGVINQAPPSANENPLAPTGAVETLVGVGNLLRGRALIEREGVILVAQSRLGRGFVTQFLFNPGREPFRSWTGRSAFWLRLLQATRENTDETLNPIAYVEVPLPAAANVNRIKRAPPSTSQRNLQSQCLENFSANLLTTHQRRTLPWVLLSILLVGYVALIGPVDYIWLKRRRKLVWTWVTFPTYVVGTTAIIYGLGYWVNAGESEWSQWTVVDWIQNGSRMRATTMARFYSVRNANYHWNDTPGLITQVREANENSIQRGTSRYFEALGTPAGTKVEAAVPVWTSRNVLGRFEAKSQKLDAVYDAPNATLTMMNPTPMNWRNCRWVTKPDHYQSLGVLKAGETKTWSLNLPENVLVGMEELQKYLFGFNYGYGQERMGIQEDRKTDLMQELFFLPILNSTTQIGSINEALDLSAGWQMGDAVFLATSDGPPNWPWTLDFHPKRYTHTVTHRIYFPATNP